MKEASQSINVEQVYIREKGGELRAITSRRYLDQTPHLRYHHHPRRSHQHNGDEAKEATSLLALNEGLSETLTQVLIVSH